MKIRFNSNSNSLERYHILLENVKLESKKKQKSSERMASCLSWSGCWLSFKLLGQSCLFFFVIGWNLTVWWHVKSSWKGSTAVHCSGDCHWAMSVCFPLHYFNNVSASKLKTRLFAGMHCLLRWDCFVIAVFMVVKKSFRLISSFFHFVFLIFLRQKCW